MFCSPLARSAFKTFTSIFLCFVFIKMSQITGCVLLPKCRRAVYSIALPLNVLQMMTVWMEQSAAQLSAVLGAAGKHVSNLSYQVTRASLIYEIIN